MIEGVDIGVMMPGFKSTFLHFHSEVDFSFLWQSITIYLIHIINNIIPITTLQRSIIIFLFIVKQNILGYWYIISH